MKFDKFVYFILEKTNSLDEYIVTMREYGFPMRIDGVMKDRWSKTTKATSPAKAASNVFYHYFEGSGLSKDRRGIQWAKFKKSIKITKIN